MIPLIKNTFINEHETKKALVDFLSQTNYLSMGENCFGFEKDFSVFQKRTFSVLFNSGGSANLAILQALKNLGRIKPGDKVGFSALTWSTNVMPIIQMQCVPVAIDCEPETLNLMSHNLVKTLKTTSLQVLFITNALGFTGDLDKIKQICDEREIILLEDNCESLGTELPSGKAGNFGLASTFSFYVAHHMSTIEGGMATTDDEELAVMLRIVRANGWDRNLNPDQQKILRQKYGVEDEFHAKYTFYDLGFNLRPTEITGFLGRFQLKFVEDMVNQRERNFQKYEAAVKLNPEIITLKHTHISKLSSFAIPVICKSPELQKKYLYQFSGAGIEIRPMIAGNIQNQPFYKKYVKEIQPLPGTDYIHKCGFYCGNYPELTDMDMDTIIGCVKA